jgi:hypothetical protein
MSHLKTIMEERRENNSGSQTIDVRRILPALQSALDALAR